MAEESKDFDRTAMQAVVAAAAEEFDGDILRAGARWQQDQAGRI